MCEHAYRIPQASGTDFCLTCKQFIPKEAEKPQSELVMPPRILELTDKLWEKVNPWPLVSLSMAVENGWYISIINTVEYLIMPIQRMGKPIYFSARKLSKEKKWPKYLYPSGIKKSYYVSCHDSGGKEKTSSPALIMITEGVADAVYCSNLGTSIALLGSYYDGSLDNMLSGNHIALCMDCDAPGILAAMRIMGQLKDVASKKIVMLPNRCDPTDIPLDKLRQIVYTS